MQNMVPCEALLPLALHTVTFLKLIKSDNIALYEPFHAKTYNLDWRHNLVKRRHNFAGKFS